MGSSPRSPADPLADIAALEGVASAMAAARDGVDALLRDRGLRRTTPDLTGESLLRGARASASLEAPSPDEAALRLSTELLSLVPVLRRSPLQAFARMHTVAAKGTVADALLGVPRDRAAAERITALGWLLLDETRAPGLVVAAVVHAELHTAGPFATHNSVVARAAERLVLVARGVDPTSLTVPEAGHLALAASYAPSLQAYAEGGAAGVRVWLLRAAEAFTAGAQASPLRD